MAKEIYTAKAFEDFNGSKEPYTFTGEWENGKPNGYGIKTYSNGTINRGYFKDGMLHGYGVCHYSDGTLFEGNFVNDLKNGYGVEIGKIVYRGFFKDDNYHGKGILRIENVIDYVGDLHGPELFHGVGMLDRHFDDGTYYVGEIYNGKQEGFGKLIYGDGVFYEGEWKDNLFHGKGSLTFPQRGYRFETTYIHGKESGLARYVSILDGRVIKEEYWVNGKKQ